jgi:hypothetical protein
MPAKPAQSSKKKRPAKKLTGLERYALHGKRYRPDILEYVATHQYTGLKRRDVIGGLNAPRLGARESKPSDRSAIAKTLGKLVADGSLVERLAIGENPSRQREGKDTTRHLGYVAISVSLSSLREEQGKEELGEKDGKKPKSQEEIVLWIADKTAEWTKKNRSSPVPKPPSSSKPVSPAIRLPFEVVLLDVAVIHGGWDMLVSVSYSQEDAFMRYVREVVQMAPHVRGTQSIFVASNVARILSEGKMGQVTEA